MLNTVVGITVWALLKFLYWLIYSIIYSYSKIEMYLGLEIDFCMVLLIVECKCSLQLLIC